MALLPESLKVLFEDDALLAVAKPAGLHVFPSRSSEQGSVWSWLDTRLPELKKVGDPRNPAIVHRLDRDTSGVLLVARDDKTYWKLREAFRQGDVVKSYLALVEGVLADPVEVDQPLGSRYRHSKKVSVEVEGRQLRGVCPAQSSVMPLGAAHRMTLCQVNAITGVRHQVRAHLAYIGHPIVGDRRYGASRVVKGLGKRFFLHAQSVHFPHPLHRTPLEIFCPLPDELRYVLENLGICLANC